MLQNSRLVGDTLLDVISAGRTLEIEQALEALEAVGFSPDLDALPMGLEHHCLTEDVSCLVGKGRSLPWHEP